MITVMTSALWHGIYPGYFVSFFHWVLFIQTINEVYRQKRRVGSIVHSFHEKHKRLYDIIENMVSTFAMTYFGVPFHKMILGRVWTFVKATEFVAFIALYIVFFLIVEMGVFGRSKKEEKTAAAPVTENLKTD